MNNNNTDLKAKKFIIYSKKDQEYVQYLCKFKDEVTEKSYNDFCKKIEVENLSQKTIKFFEDMKSNNIIDFKELIREIKEENLEQMTHYISAFLDMFKFDIDKKTSSEQYSLDFMVATKSIFGYNKKIKKLIDEFSCARKNYELINLIGYNLDSNNKNKIKALVV